MTSDTETQLRQANYSRNDCLEALLTELNSDLALAENHALRHYAGKLPDLPPIFVMGAPRCGSTLFMHWLATTGAFSYPSNLLSRFWAAPIVGARIQKLLTDPEFDFRNELYDLKNNPSFHSDHGKTEGALSPNEFWYFWRRFLPGNAYRPSNQLRKCLDADTLRAEIAGLTHILGKPFAAKGMIFNDNIPLLAELFPNALFVWVRRDPAFNIQSILEARERQYGDRNIWYSFKTKHYEKLKNLPPLESVSGQVFHIHQSIHSSFKKLLSGRKLQVDYTQFCNDPEDTYNVISNVLAQQDIMLPAYQGPTYFEPRNEWRLDTPTKQQALNSYHQFASGISENASSKDRG